MATTLSRRSFLKTIGATSAAGALGIAFKAPEIKAFAAADPKALEKQEIKGLCLMCKHSGCSNIVTMENGVVTNIRGNPDSPANRGTQCARGKATLYHLYNPYRVKAPMKRTNPKKGLNVDPKWVEITWEEALSTVSKKFKEIRQKDPRELVIMTGFGMSELTMNGLMMEFRFPAAFGTPNVSTTKGQFCAIHYGVCLTQNNMPTCTEDAGLCNYLILLGRSGGINASYANGDARSFVRNVERGMKVVCVDPMCSSEGSATDWVPILPGTDLAFVLALTHVVLYELDDYDKEFVRDRTNAPYLIGDDKYYIRGPKGKPMIWDLSDNKAKEWDDPTLNKAYSALIGEYTYKGKKVRPAFMAFKENYKDYTPEWAEKITTVPAARTRKIAADFIAHAQIGSTITIDGHVFPYRPAAIIGSRGITNHENGATADVAHKLLNMLIGNFYVPGGIQGTGIGERLFGNDDGIPTPGFEAVPMSKFDWPPNHIDLHGVMPHRHSTNTVALQVINEGPSKWGITYKPKALFVAGGNPILTNASYEMAVDAIKKIPFVVNIAYHLDEITQMSDILLVSPSMLESMGHVDYFGAECSMSTGEPGYNTGQTQRLFRNPVPMIYNTREPNGVILDLCERIGMTDAMNNNINGNALIGPRPFSPPEPLKPQYRLDPKKKYTYEEIIDKSFKNIYGDEKGIDYLREHSMIATYDLNDAQVYPSYYNKTVRFQLYAHTQMESGDFLMTNMKKHIKDPVKYMGINYTELAKHYEPVMVYTENKINQENKTNQGYDLYATTCRIPMSMFRLGGLDQNPWVLDWNNRNNPYYNSVCMNPDTAKAQGLKTGDKVTVESPYGKTEGKLFLTETMHPQCIVIPGALGRVDKSLGEQTANQVCFNKLLTGKLGHISPIHGGVETAVRVKVYKA